MEQEIDPMQEQYKMQSALQKEGIEGEMGAQAPYMLQQQQTIQAALLEQLNPERTIKEIRLTLKGQREDEEGRIVKEGDSLMNDKGIGNIILSIKSVVNTNTVMSALKEVTIKKMMIDLMDDIIDDLTLNWKEYGIKNENDRDRVEGCVKRMVYPALMRSCEGGERRFLGRTTVKSINTAPRFQSQKKENFWSKFKL